MTTRHRIALADRSERLVALRDAAAKLHTLWPRLQCDIYVRVELNVIHCNVTFHWPGVVKVTRRSDGALIAQSRPGKPQELDAGALRCETGWSAW